MEFVLFVFVFVIGVERGEYLEFVFIYFRVCLVYLGFRFWLVVG